MDSKRGQWRLLAALKAGVFGDGLLVRARSTTLVLLGFTAAVGLTMVALALNQGWTLVPGVPLPGLGDREQAVSDATVAAGAGAHAHPGAVSQSGAGGRVSNASAHQVRNGSGGKSAPAGSQAPGSDATVVSHSTPAAPPGGGSPNPAPAPTSGPAPSPSPVAEQPVAAPAPEPASSPPAPTPAPTPQRAPESATPSHATPVSNEGGGRDHGHHFGRGSSSGHGHSAGRGHSAAPESNGDSEPAPSSAPAPEPEAPEGTEIPSKGPPWGHEGDHGHGRDRSR